jgi:GT2 family glycosyltransferase
MIDVIIHTIRGREIKTLESVKKLNGYTHYDLTIVRDAKTPSHARNYGVLKAKNDVIAIFDDDVSFTPENFMLMLSKVKKGVCVWSNGSTILMCRDDYIKLGGFDERIFRCFGDDSEFLCRMNSLGFKIEYRPELVKHKSGKPTFRKRLLGSFNEPFIYLRYNRKAALYRLILGFRDINPIIFTANLAYVWGLIYYPFRMNIGKRSIFDTGLRDSVSRFSRMEKHSLG